MTLHQDGPDRSRLPVARLSVGDIERWHTRLRRNGMRDAGIKNQPTDVSTSSNASTASPTPGGSRRILSNCDAVPRRPPDLRSPRPDRRRTLYDHLARMAETWTDQAASGRSLAIVASTNDHVDTINHAIQTARRDAGHLDPNAATRIAAGETVHIGDVVATRRNDRRLVTSAGEPVRNRDTWTVTANTKTARSPCPTKVHTAT